MHRQAMPGANVRMQDLMESIEALILEDDVEKQIQQRRLQIINFAHSQWGFNNWAWGVNKHELDFVKYVNGNYSAAMVAYVTVNVRSMGIHRDNIGYAICAAPTKGMAVYLARQWSTLNGLYETILAFGGSVAVDLMELVEPNHVEVARPAPAANVQPPEMNNNMNAHQMPMGTRNVGMAMNHGQRYIISGRLQGEVHRLGQLNSMQQPMRSLHQPIHISSIPQAYLSRLHFSHNPQPTYYEYAQEAYNPAPRVVNRHERRSRRSHEEHQPGCWLDPGVSLEQHWTEGTLKKMITDEIAKYVGQAQPQPELEHQELIAEQQRLLEQQQLFEAQPEAAEEQAHVHQEPVPEQEQANPANAQ